MKMLRRSWTEDRGPCCFFFNADKTIVAATAKS